MSCCRLRGRGAGLGDRNGTSLLPRPTSTGSTTEPTPGPSPCCRRGSGRLPLALVRTSPPGECPPALIDRAADDSAAIRPGLRRRFEGELLCWRLEWPGRRQRRAVDPGLLQRRLGFPRWFLSGGPGHGGRAVQRGLRPTLPPGPASRCTRCATWVESPMACTSGTSPCFSISTTPAPDSPATPCSLCGSPSRWRSPRPPSTLIERPIRRRTFLRGWRAWAVTPVAVWPSSSLSLAATTPPPGRAGAPAAGADTVSRHRPSSKCCWWATRRP